MSQPSNKTTIQEIVKLFNIKREQMNKSNTPIEFEIRMDKKLIKKSEYEKIYKEVDLIRKDNSINLVHMMTKLLNVVIL